MTVLLAILPNNIESTFFFFAICSCKLYCNCPLQVVADAGNVTTTTHSLSLSLPDLHFLSFFHSVPFLRPTFNINFSSSSSASASAAAAVVYNSRLHSSNSGSVFSVVLTGYLVKPSALFYLSNHRNTFPCQPRISISTLRHQTCPGPAGSDPT